MTIYKRETEDLETHVTVCEERYRNLESRFEKLEDIVNKIAEGIDHNSKSMRTTIIGASGSIVVAIIGLIAVMLDK